MMMMMMMRLNSWNNISCKVSASKLFAVNYHSRCYCVSLLPSSDNQNPQSFSLSDVICQFRRMTRMRPRPCVDEFNEVVSLVAQKRRFCVALSFLDEMRRQGVPFDRRTLTIAIDCYCSIKRVDLAFVMLARFVKYGYSYERDASIFASIFTSLLKELIRGNEVEKAAKLLRELLKKDLCLPYQDMLIYFIKKNGKGAYGATYSLQLLALFEECGSGPSEEAYDTLVDGLCRIPPRRLASIVLHILSETHFLLDPDTRFGLIMGYFISSCNKELMHLLEKMASFPYSSLESSTFNALVELYCNEEMWEQVPDVLRLAKISRTSAMKKCGNMYRMCYVWRR